MPLTLKLLHGEQCTKTVKASQEYCLRTKAIATEKNTNYPIEWRERKREKKGGRGVEGKDGELRVTLATKIGVCIVPRVLVVLENIKASWLETEKHYRGHLSHSRQQVQWSSIGGLSFPQSKETALHRYGTLQPLRRGLSLTHNITPIGTWSEKPFETQWNCDSLFIAHAHTRSSFGLFPGALTKVHHLFFFFYIRFQSIDIA